MTSPRVLPFGDRGLLVEVDTVAGVLALHARLAATRRAGVIDLVPAARTVLVHVDPDRLSLATARAWIAHADAAPPPEAADAPLVEIPIVYDGPDLDNLAHSLGLAPEALAARHAAGTWTVAFTGFAPGFGYLVSEDWPYDVPRRATPRTRVPAGAVGLAGAFSGAYPRETPGGWQLIGTTTAPLFDADAGAALLAPGTHVRFVPTTPALAAPTAHATPAAPALAAPARETAAPARPTPTTFVPALRILESGLLATLQDQGRPGHASEGIAPAGAADRAALRTANRLVGTPEGAAGVEVTMGGFRAVAERDLWAVVTGAWGDIALDGRPIDPYDVFAWRRGAELRLDWFRAGARAYLAVRGGLADSNARPGLVAGSRATDTLAGLGPAPLRPGDVLALTGAHPLAPIPADDVRPWAPPPDAIDVELAPGPRADWLTDAAALFDTAWTVSPRADRVGIRLEGTPLERARTDELPSEGMLPGAIQVPPDGMPVILGPDGPVTGGYPVIAVVTDAFRDALAQARPGAALRFRRAR